jgi:hypothetical protein
MTLLLRPLFRSGSYLSEPDQSRAVLQKQLDCPHVRPPLSAKPGPRHHQVCDRWSNQNPINYRQPLFLPERIVVGVGFDPLASVFIPVARANLWISRARFSELIFFNLAKSVSHLSKGFFQNYTPARFFDPPLDHKSGHSVTTEQHRPAICGMFGDLQNLHGLSVVKPVSPSRSRP